jgi:hypothetical protein
VSLGSLLVLDERSRPGRLSRRGSTLGACSSASGRDFGMDEAAPFAVGARSGDPESLGECQGAVTISRQGSYTYPADLCFVFGVPWDLPKLLLSVGELALGPVPATSLLFPATAEFRLVETQLPVVRAWTVTTRVGSERRWRPGKSFHCCSREHQYVPVYWLWSCLAINCAGSEIILCVSIWLDRTGWQTSRESGSTEELSEGYIPA